MLDTNDKIISFNVWNNNLQFRIIKGKLYSNWEDCIDRMVETKIKNDKILWKDSFGYRAYTDDIQKKIDINKIRILFENNIDYLLYSMGYDNI